MTSRLKKAVNYYGKNQKTVLKRILEELTRKPIVEINSTEIIVINVL